MELSKVELPYFVEYVLLDEATRPPAKRQTRGLEGFWLAQHTAKSPHSGKAKRRGSDLRGRCYVCIAALHEVAGYSIDGAAAEVAQALGEGNQARVSVIRVGYYECLKMLRNAGHYVEDLKARWWGQFLTWRGWVICSDENALGGVLALYERQFGDSKRERLAKLMADIRNDPVQHGRNRAWWSERVELIKNRLESQRELLETEFEFVGQLVELATLQLSLGAREEALSALDEALRLYRRHRHRRPDRRVELAIRTIKAFRKAEAKEHRLSSEKASRKCACHTTAGARGAPAVEKGGKPAAESGEDRKKAWEAKGPK